MNRHGDAEVQIRKALAIEERLVADSPSNLEYAVDLGGGYLNFGYLRRATERPGDSLEWFAKAIDVLDGVLRREPRLATARGALQFAFWNRAEVLVQLEKHRDSVADWVKAGELDSGRNRPFLRLQQALALAHSGDAATAIKLAEESAQAPVVDVRVYYDLARVYALSAATVKDDAKLQDRYAARAVELLRQAFAKGYKEIDHLKKDVDLKPLRKRDDFKQLLKEVAEKK
jgi:tetratricopeptide (TPR) repeat protein